MCLLEESNHWQLHETDPNSIISQGLKGAHVIAGLPEADLVLLWQFLVYPLPLLILLPYGSLVWASNGPDFLTNVFL